MGNYEGMIIVKPDLDKDAKKRVTDFVSLGITKEGGSIKDFAEWGKHRLAYKIKRHNEGLYILMHFSLGHDKVERLKKAYGLNEDILKTLIVRMQDEK